MRITIRRQPRVRLAALLLPLFLLPAPGASAQDATAWIGRFDSLVADGLPATVELPPTTAGTGARGESVLRVTSRLSSTAVFPGEPSATHYDATLDGATAVVTRSPTGLDVTVVSPGGARVIAATLGAGIEETVLPRPEAATAGRASPADFHDDVEIGGGPTALPTFADSTAPIAIRIFLHDELRSSQTRAIHAGYVAWWLRDMETVVLPGQTIVVTYLQPIPGISDLTTTGMTTIDPWSLRVKSYVQSRRIRPSWKNKYVLLTANVPTPDRLGVADPVKGVAMASLSGPYTVVAHELGHTFGAEHSLGQTRLGRWLGCRTTMSSPYLQLVAHCYAYSEANMASIRRHVNLKGYLPPHWRAR